MAAQAVKLPAGHAVLYPGTSLHEVTPVTRGHRLACFFWVQSMVRSDEQRRLLYDLDMNLLSLRSRHGESAETTALTGSYHNLLAHVGEVHEAPTLHRCAGRCPPRGLTRLGAALRCGRIEPPRSTAARVAAPEGADRLGRPCAGSHGPHAPPLRTTLPKGVVSLADHEAMVNTVLPPQTLAYFNGGAADEITLRANTQAWQDIPLHPRVMRPLAGGHTRLTLLGRTLPHPILVAPMAYQSLAHPHAEQATALAAAVLGAGMVLSTQATTRLEDVAQLVLGEADRGPLWFQLYMLPDRAFMRELLQRVEAAGYEALVLTVDAPVQGPRERERRSGYRRPAEAAAVNLAGRVAPSPLPLAARAKPPV